MQIMVLDVVRPEMAIDLGSEEVEPMVDEAAVNTVWGLLKQSGLMVGLKLSMCVICIILLKNEWLEICVERNCQCM